MSRAINFNTVFDLKLTYFKQIKVNYLIIGGCDVFKCNLGFVFAVSVQVSRLLLVLVISSCVI